MFFDFVVYIFSFLPVCFLKRERKKKRVGWMGMRGRYGRDGEKKTVITIYYMKKRFSIKSGKVIHT